MELKDICLRILEAKAVFNEIAPKAGAYMVVVINDQQYNPLVFRPGNGLLVHYIRLYPDLIGPQYQALIMEMVSTIIELEKELFAIDLEIEKLKRERFDDLADIAGTEIARELTGRDNSRLAVVNSRCNERRQIQLDWRILELKKESDGKQNKLFVARKLYDALLTKVDFSEPRIEIRFDELDMDEILRIKEHPLVKKIGKTPVGDGSIRIVIG